jgi:glucose/arabinose dehydrogenase
MCSLNPLSNAALSLGFCAHTLPIDIDQARSVIATSSSSVLALERGSSSVVFFSDTDGDGLPDTKRTVAEAPRLNHGLALNEGYLYASSDQFVYRWPFSDSTTFDEVGDMEIVIENINADGTGGAPFGHTTRTLVFDESGRLYVSVGSASNVDPDSYRSRIRRFLLTEDFPINFLDGEVFADGLRNEVGLAFDGSGALWGVENGADRLFRNDLGGDIHNDNPVRRLDFVHNNAHTRR